MSENFGQRMARLKRREEMNQEFRLRNAVKRGKETPIWIHPSMSEEIKGAVFAAEKIGARFELYIDNDEVHSRIVEYKKA